MRNYTNTPPLNSLPTVSFMSANEVKVVTNVKLPNSCLASAKPVALTQSWGNSTHSYVWLDLSFETENQVCPELYVPQDKEFIYTFPVENTTQSVNVLIPNYPKGRELPVFIGTATRN